ncbi:MAG: hypothetical protein M5U14_05820 [Acidimicrobiia bacterium]|nr:hypothetical protein [Acidimicrobiia bacterium]
MEIVAALFVENLDFRALPGPSTRIDITGAYFSVPVEAFPAHLEPHLVVLVRAPEDDPGLATLEVVFSREGTEVGRHRQPFQVEPGRFGYRLVKGDLDLPGPGTTEARCTIVESGSTVTVPLTALQAP